MCVCCVCAMCCVCATCMCVLCVCYMYVCVLCVCAMCCVCATCMCVCCVCVLCVVCVLHVCVCAVCMCVLCVCVQCSCHGYNACFLSSFFFFCWKGFTRSRDEFLARINDPKRHFTPYGEHVASYSQDGRKDECFEVYKVSHLGVH